MMVNALVLYHSLFGNTRDVAHALADGIRETGIHTDCMGIEEIKNDQLKNYHFLAIGGPTHMISLSKGMKAFLKNLKSVNLQGKTRFCFDTRNPSRMNEKRWFIFENSAARRIEGKMKRLKIKIIKPRQSAIVFGREGPF